MSAIIGYSLSQAYRSAAAATIAPYEYVAMPLAIAWGWIAFGDWPDGWVWVGIVLIAEPGNADSDIAIPLATSAVGLALGVLLTGDGEGTSEAESSASPAASGPAAGALLNWSGDGLAVGLPLPSPTTVFDPARNGRRHTAWNVPLLRLRF